ncbi:MAG: TolC family protein [Balneolaceae bacterium]|nr:MAG: TolC family protein [Balneolaceae bacterium]
MSIQRILNKSIAITVLLLFIITAAIPSKAEARQAPAPGDTLSLGLDEALEIALINSYMLRKGLLDIDEASAQVREAWGNVYPQVNATANYTRNIKSPNPFAGSSAGDFFQSFGAIGWLAYNERARTDGDPSTSPIPFDEFLDRQQQGYEEAGITPPGLDSNPFAIDNQFQGFINVTQALYNGTAFAAIRGAEQFKKLTDDQRTRDRQIVSNEVKTAYYRALLAQEQSDVLRRSIQRTRRTVEDAARTVAEGVTPKYQRLNAEVELANLQTNFIEANNQAALALKNLNLILGIPVDTPIRLSDSMEVDRGDITPFMTTEEAYELAKRQRPDLQQLEGLIKLNEVQKELTRSTYFPVVNAFANYGYLGNVPDNRTIVSQINGQSFNYTSRDLGFFDTAYWDPTFAVGVQLNWNLFNGFQTRSRVQQNRIAIKKSQIDLEMAMQGVYLEVDQAVRNVQTAWERINSQERNIERAELNYEYAVTRLREGVGTAIEERQANLLLDQTRLTYLAAVFDYLTAVSRLEAAIGKPI